MGISTVGRFSTVGWCVIIRLSAVDTVHQSTHTHKHKQNERKPTLQNTKEKNGIHNYVGEFTLCAKFHKSWQRGCFQEYGKMFTIEIFQLITCLLLARLHKTVQVIFTLNVLK